jgi:hypothetical protein
MRFEVIVPRQVELTLSKPGNHLRIENHPDGVWICAARDNLSAAQKLFYVRYLAAEGYIPERYQWFSDSQSGAYSGLEWSVDNSWLAHADGAQQRALRQIVRVLWCATLLWLALMSFAFVRARSFPPSQNYPSGRG